jgi:hypothetical protein
VQSAVLRLKLREIFDSADLRARQPEKPRSDLWFLWLPSLCVV